MGPTDGEAVRRSGFTSGGYVTLGLRVALDGDGSAAERIRIVAVFENMDGEESMEDLGAYVGSAEEVLPTAGELGHLRLHSGDGDHDLTLHRLETGELELRLDGERVRGFDVPEAEVRRREPFLIHPPLERPSVD